jgi:hypothetical protein
VPADGLLEGQVVDVTARHAAMICNQTWQGLRVPLRVQDPFEITSKPRPNRYLPARSMSPIG